MSNNPADIQNRLILDHPAGLFVLFFTEMWERFSYYGMRALFVLFLTSAMLDGGWGWERSEALSLYAWYTGLVYITPIFGGLIADKLLGYRNAVGLGALVMTIGHACLAFETVPLFYAGCAALIIGNGLFKPNISSIVGQLYKDSGAKKDAAYTIFYMGINAGAFLGILLCGYIGEKVGWSYGFGLAGIFMFFGLLQFWFAQDIFGSVGLKPVNDGKALSAITEDGDKRNPFTTWQIVVSGLAAVLGLVWIINDPVSKISGGATNALDFSVGSLSGPNFTIITALVLFLIVLIYRLTQYSPITRDRMIAVWFFAFITIFFWAVFEQAPGSLTIFARDYTQRVLEGSAGMTYKIFNSLMTLIPLGIITWVLGLLFKQTFGKYSLSNIFLALSFVIIWGIAIWMLYTEFLKDATEIPASWFGVLNSLYIIIFAPLFSKWWESKYNPNANMKYAIGMFFLGLGMACVAFGASDIAPGAKTASVSMIWLVLVYFFHTMGELCVSPVALSYVSKLVPGRMIAFMFGIWYLAVAIGMKLAGVFGEASEGIAEANGLSYFFWILTAVSVGLGVLCIVTYPIVKKLMHGIR